VRVHQIPAIGYSVTLIFDKLIPVTFKANKENKRFKGPFHKKIGKNGLKQ